MRIWPASLSAKGPIQINWRACGRAGVRLAVSITPAVLSPGLPFLIGAI